MITYVGILDDENYVVSYRPVFYKHDEVGQLDINSLELRDREVELPLTFPELYGTEDFKVVDGMVMDSNDNPFTIFSPSYREIKDKSDFTKYEWLQHKQDEIFKGSTYSVSQDPLLYYVDVVEELSPILGNDLLGELLHILPKTYLTPVIVKGKDAVAKLYSTFTDMHELNLKITQLLRSYAETQDTTLISTLDELILEVRGYL